MVNLVMFTLRLFGNPHIEQDGELVQLGTRKAIALAAYLAATDRSHSRDVLIALLWPELDQRRGRAALRSTLSALKKGLADTGLVVAGESVGLLTADLTCDLWQFKAHLAAVQRHRHRDDLVCDECLAALREAAELYHADFMAGFSLSDSAAYDEWQFFQAEQWREQFGRVLERLVVGCQARSQWEAALDYARRWLGLDPLQEAAHQALMQVYGAMGQWTAVQRQFQLCTDLLREELGVEPSAATVAVYEQSRAGERGSRGAEEISPPLPRSSAPPLPSTPLVGRAAELAQIEARLADGNCRLLTLVGSGGMGKTRLGLETAVRQQAPFIPLAPLTDASHLVATIAAALNFSFYGIQPPQTQLLDFLREKSLLLVLDNFEHLLDGTELLLAILQHAPGVKMLVTSRERLHVRGEWIVEIGGLPVSDEAVALFLQTARQLYPDFPAEKQMNDIRRICLLLEGMPLAIELAAAWVRLLNCAEIAAEIAHNLDFLATNLRDMPERHRSLRAVFDHSWQLLTEAERQAFGRLSVFHGGFERRAATAVTQTTLPILSALVDKSLLRRGADGRYHIPEALRQFAAEKRRPIEAQLKREHTLYFAQFLRAREEVLKGGGQQKAALAEIGAEIENVRQAWRWAVANGEETAVSQAMESLFLYYEMRSLFGEGAEMFGEGGEARGEERVAGVGSRYGRFLHRLGRYSEAKAVLQSSLAAARAAGDVGEVAFALLNLGYVAWSMSDYEAARQLYEESLQLYRQSEEQWSVSRVLNALAIVPQDLAEMKGLLEESLAISRELGDLWGVARALNNLGIVTRDVLAARALYEQTVAICREIDDRYLMIFPLINLGHMARVQGDFAEARRLYEESLATCREIGYRPGVARCWGHLGTVAYALGEYEAAADYCQQGLPLCMALGDQRGLGLLYYTLGLVSGVAATAVAHFQKSLAIFREAKDKQGEAWPLLGLAQMAHQSGDEALAQAYAQESLVVFEQVGDKDGLVRGHTLLGRLLADKAEAEEHLRLAWETAVALQAQPLLLEVLVGLAAWQKPEVGLAMARFVVGATAVEWHTREEARRLVAEWEAVGVETAVVFETLDEIIKTVQGKFNRENNAN